MTYKEWKLEGERLFGPDMMDWKFECPACHHIATAKEWKMAGAPQNTVAFSCVGRWLEKARDAFAKGKGPCNYAGGGLIGLNPVDVDGGRYFAFAKSEPHP